MNKKYFTTILQSFFQIVRLFFDKMFYVCGKNEMKINHLKIRMLNML